MSPRGGFVLIEALLAVAIFALGVITLGRCISQGLFAERLQIEDARAQRVLQNRYEEIEARAIDAKDAVDHLSAPYEGLTLDQTVRPLHRRDELGREMAKLSVVTLTVQWTSNGAPESRSLTFYATTP